MDNVKIGQIIDIGIAEGSRQVPGGCTIKFLTDIPVPLGDLVHVGINGRSHYFSIKRHSISPEKLLEMEATESGYYRSKLEKRKDLDIRKLLMLDVEWVKDEATIAQVRKEASYCVSVWGTL